MIPKVIHYCWFGGNEKPDIIKKCIQSWREKCPDYEIKEWNESNFDINMYTYTKEAYEQKKWAFVSDVARIWIIYHYGGIYMDTDIELFDSFDNYLCYKMFAFFESEINVAFGLGYGAENGIACLAKILDYYENKPFIINGQCDLSPCPAVHTAIIKKEIPLKPCLSIQIIDNMVFFPFSEYMKDFKHYGTATWTDKPNLSMDVSQKVWKDTKLKCFLRKPSRLEFVEKHFPKKLYSAYIFLSYDFLEYGGKFFIKKYILRK